MQRGGIYIYVHTYIHIYISDIAALRIKIPMVSYASHIDPTYLHLDLINDLSYVLYDQGALSHGLHGARPPAHAGLLEGLQLHVLLVGEVPVTAKGTCMCI
jgi:hypothetical protein